jgi:hypothetical protein
MNRKYIWLVAPLALLLIAAAGIGPALIQATSIELGPAGTTDTTITRVSPGVAAIEGVNIGSGGDQLGSDADRGDLVVSGGAGIVGTVDSVEGFDFDPADAGADACFGWDDSANAYENLTAGECLAAAGAEAADADLTSWAGITRAAGFDTWVATPSSANLDSLLTDDTGSGLAVFATSPVLTTPEISAFELGAGQTDTTFTRSAAGVGAIEGKAIKSAGEQTIYMTAGAGTYPVSGGIASCASNTAFDSGSNDIFMRQCAFSATADNALYFTISFPKSADESVDLQVQIDWTSGTTTDATDDVIWNATSVCFGNDDAINANAFAAVDAVTDTQTAAGDILRTGRITAITPAGTWAEGDVCILRISRDADNGSDNFNGTADFIGVAVYFQDNAANDN